MNRLDIIKKISSIANKLDEKGLTKLADEMDDILKETAESSDLSEEVENFRPNDRSIEDVFANKEEDSDILYKEIERVKADFLKYAIENDMAGKDFDTSEVLLSVIKKGDSQYNFAIENGFCVAFYCEI